MDVADITFGLDGANMQFVWSMTFYSRERLDIYRGSAPLHFITHPWEQRVANSMPPRDTLLCLSMEDEVVIDEGSHFNLTDARGAVTCQACLEWLHA